ncbi:DNA helicase rad5 [Apophysomyces sp. BC1034]|nr:DNA helicase rad5 [Apophysomyces sp. BC1015]KAG0182853.1 DNA helicase rad5 [Apophysomyces sp. BC1021]KAG0194938.1 DNA helicase rad5 [Apophysomyces sp. BC1034]
MSNPRKRPFSDEHGSTDPAAQITNDDKIQTLRMLLGDQVPEQKLIQLLTQCKGDLDMAANTYFATAATSKASRAESETSTQCPAMSYIGWSIYTGRCLVQEGDSVTIVRDKTAGEGSLWKRSRFINTHKPNLIVRFRSPCGRELGRLPQHVAKYVSKLIDLGLCEFKATVVCSPPIWKTGDDIILHMKCYMLDSAFGDPETYFGKPMENRRTVWNRGGETADEKSYNDRTLALLSIIRAVNLRPTRSSMQRMNMTIGQNEDELQDLISQSLKISPSSTESTEDRETEETEVSNNDLNNIYQKAQIFDSQITEVDQPETLALTLKAYQKRALAWMSLKEATKYDDKDIDTRAMHPLFEEYTFPTEPDAPTWPNRPKLFYVNPYSGEMMLQFPELNTQDRGGILADEMGLGKTIEILSLIHRNRFNPDCTPIPTNHQDASPTTLIVCPMSLLAQWRDEMIRGSKPGTLKVDVYYGDSRSTNFKTRYCRWDGSAPDVLITTYGTVLSECGKSGDSLFHVEFWRIVLDEAHQIKNRLSKTSRACHDIRARRRWAVTGTPIQNKLEDLYSLVRFLKYEPWANYTFWRTFITIPFEKKDVRAMKAVQTVLEPIVLRRTKDMRDANGNPMVPLPQKQVNIEYLQFSAAEKDIYDSVYSDSKTKFSDYCVAGNILSHYASIFQLLIRLRQVSCHPYLVIGNKSEGELRETLRTDYGSITLESLIAKYSNGSDMSLSQDQQRYNISVLQNLLSKQKSFPKKSEEDIESQDEDECPICLENVDSMIMMACSHMACRPCVMDYLQKQEDKGLSAECPVCRQPVQQSDLLEVSQNNDHPEPVLTVQRAVGGYKSSTKIDAMMRHLRLYASEGRKTVVFSQFTSFLDIIEIALKRAGTGFERLDGTQSQAHREKVLTRFSSQDSSESSDVLLISLRAGGIGLNLTCASRVLMMDPWWNFAVESQAIDRVHRLGQQSDVIVTRFITRDTVEERMLEIQERKHDLVNELYMSRDETRTKQLQDLQILFGSRPSGRSH